MRFSARRLALVMPGQTGEENRNLFLEALLK